MEESITLIRGHLGTWIAGTEKILAPGDRVQIAPGTPHRWWPLGDEQVRVLLEVRPGDRFEQMWRQFMGLSQDGKMHPKRGPKFLQIVAMQREFSDVMQVAGIPPFVQRVLFGALAPIAQVRGYKGKYDQYLIQAPSAVVEPEALPANVETS
ncbi:MAG: hypothetical protein DLM70_16335 [Chloroflexi bacterium]|nr:MAG: hypothetical protein DLM70_16335 [Chloroflexota bacterium]